MAFATTGPLEVGVSSTLGEGSAGVVLYFDCNASVVFFSSLVDCYAAVEVDCPKFI